MDVNGIIKQGFLKKVFCRVDKIVTSKERTSTKELEVAFLCIEGSEFDVLCISSSFFNLMNG